MEGLGFTPDEIRQALASCTPLCKCQDCQENRELRIVSGMVKCTNIEEVTQERTT